MTTIDLRSTIPAYFATEGLMAYLDKTEARFNVDLEEDPEIWLGDLVVYRNSERHEAFVVQRVANGLHTTLLTCALTDEGWQVFGAPPQSLTLDVPALAWRFAQCHGVFESWAREPEGFELSELRGKLARCFVAVYSAGGSTDAEEY